MADDSMDVEVVNVVIETRFAQILEILGRQPPEDQDPFTLVQQSRDVASTKALQTKDLMFENSTPELEQEFVSWQLETKLWHLAEILYSFRLARIEPHKSYGFSSVPVVEENFRKQNTKLAEIIMIIEWIQVNSPLVDTSKVPIATKWNNTKRSVQTRDLKVLAESTSESAQDYVSELDPDGPLRSGKRLHSEDVKTDDEVFKIIYKLVLYRNFDEAITIANETGNYPLSMILVGDMLPYLDTKLDGEYIEERSIELTTSQGCRHKLMWYQAVYKLSQQTNLNKYEKLIYNYLSGANISENLKEAPDWDECLLLYCNQVMVSELLQFYNQFYKKEVSETLDIIIPKPQIDGIDAILNALSTVGNSVGESSRHPIRIITGGVMIKKISPLVTDTATSHSSSNNKVYENTSLLRILVHLAIFLRWTDAEHIDPTDFTKLVILYIKKLSTVGLNKLIPFYLQYIPGDIEAVEYYSDLLCSIRSKEEKLQQIQICKKLAYFNAPINSSTGEERLNVVLKRTVEKILDKTESHYQPSLFITIKDQYNTIDEIDEELYESADYLLANSMYEDTIIVSMVIIKRFLLSGKLAALKEFAKEKNFKQIVNSYDNDLGIRQFNSENFTSSSPSISEEDREELLNYDLLIKGLNSISEWKRFVEDNGKNKTNFKTKDVHHSINKITTQLNDLVMRWFVNTPNELLREFRNLYVPYLVIELLKIYEFSRFNNPEYLNKSFDLIKSVANEDENDLLVCFMKSGKLSEFLSKCGEVALAASEKGVTGIFV
ncbi:Nucleoporin nup84 [Yamadazyma tenuis]|uniref:Nuclear pore complex protein n=1 Tax=Candida tenuis (strain ATCC 10573 / BCRC 21748 / CBS 615 / JCM 9827 / NBRC 10315 / NRRL Y-1498 / VKM Y-70) TaxID=590646 RepID=G3B6P6_CANTC|nr:uncharacterized protein CANTEDRAFT_98200 [Yamadazyma tenuis ATCC 10573]EGV62982.1 hypothetical protein CANTEDRAFT_98200 [Yamadazyma tenuis ATCC 10573]WEJ97196.1 Nucleoporin nup84 [Yamadazyma tenuis]